MQTEKHYDWQSFIYENYENTWLFETGLRKTNDCNNGR